VHPPGPRSALDEGVVERASRLVGRRQDGHSKGNGLRDSRNGDEDEDEIGFVRFDGLSLDAGLDLLTAEERDEARLVQVAIVGGDIDVRTHVRPPLEPGPTRRSLPIDHILAKVRARRHLRWTARTADERDGRGERRKTREHWAVRGYPSALSSAKGREGARFTGDGLAASLVWMSGEHGDRAGGHGGAFAAPGTVIAGKYQVERVLGSGGMGVVLAAKHLQLGQRVAIKFMRDEAALDAQAVSRFLREAQAAAALSSEHVTKVLDVATLESGPPYMVMEFLSGVDLGAILRRDGPFAARDAVATILQACEAIAEAHAVGIVHRDLKPANLFVTRRIDGTPLVKVLDFGVSKLTELNESHRRREDLTASGSIMGSPGYMSPEQVRNSKAADARSDIWSLGVILYEVLTGKNPFIGETIGETFARIVSEDAPPIQSLRAEIPAGLAAVIGQCLERSVGARIQTIDGLASKLAPFGPEDARATVDRIRRITSSVRLARQGVQATAVPSDTMAAPSISGGTGPAAWLRSGTSLPSPRTPSWQKWVAIGVGPAIAVPALVYVIVVTRAPHPVQAVSGTGSSNQASAGSSNRAPARPNLAEVPDRALGAPPAATIETLPPASDGPDVASNGGSQGSNAGLHAEGTVAKGFGAGRPTDEARASVPLSPGRQPAHVPRVLGADAGAALRAQPAAATPAKKSPYDDL